MNHEQINNECLEMQVFLEITTSDNPEELVNRLSTINVYMARSGFLLAEATRERDLQRTKAVLDHKHLGLSPSVFNSFIKSATPEAEYYVVWLDRLNRALVHAGDNIRTQISFVKEDMKLSRTGY